MTGTNKKIVIIGGSGFIGSKLTEELLLKGCHVTVVDMVQTRVVHPNLIFLRGDFSKGAPVTDLFEDVYGIINLAGATIGKKWNRGYKKLIYDSRILTTRAVIDLIKKTKNKPKVLVSASAVGYYGDKGPELLSEESGSGTDFLAKLCVDWEEAALTAENYGVRVVCIRTAHVLGQGGVLKSLEPLFKTGLGAYFGTGFQYMPWIHYRDVVGVYIHALERPISGPFNVAAPKSLTQKELFGEFAQAIHSPIPFLFRIPTFLAHIVLGDFAQALLSGQNISTAKLQNTGYVYEFESVSDAFSNLYPTNE